MLLLTVAATTKSALAASTRSPGNGKTTADHTQVVHKLRPCPAGSEGGRSKSRGEKHTERVGGGAVTRPCPCSGRPRPASTPSSSKGPLPRSPLRNPAAGKGARSARIPKCLQPSRAPGSCLALAPTPPWDRCPWASGQAAGCDLEPGPCPARLPDPGTGRSGNWSGASLPEAARELRARSAGETRAALSPKSPSRVPHKVWRGWCRWRERGDQDPHPALRSPRGAG